MRRQNDAVCRQGKIIFWIARDFLFQAGSQGASERWVTRLGEEVVHVASKLDTDERYRRAIEFKEIGVKIPIERSDVYARIGNGAEWVQAEWY